MLSNHHIVYLKRNKIICQLYLTKAGNLFSSIQIPNLFSSFPFPKTPILRELNWLKQILEFGPSSQWRTSAVSEGLVLAARDTQREDIFTRTTWQATGNGEVNGSHNAIFPSASLTDPGVLPPFSSFFNILTYLITETSNFKKWTLQM